MAKNTYVHTYTWNGLILQFVALQVDFDTKYGLTGDRKDSIFGKSTSFSMDNHNNKVDIDYEISNKTDDVEDSGVNRIIHKPSGVNSNSAYRFVEQEAAGYATYNCYLYTFAVVKNNSFYIFMFYIFN